MNVAKETKVRVGEKMIWTPFSEHEHSYLKEIVTAADADAMGIRLSSVILEKIDVGGSILPHYHDVSEVIHITQGNVRVLCNGVWKNNKAGDTFMVPAGEVHSVCNDDTAPTFQISIFIPTRETTQSNCFFKTFLVNVSSPFKKKSEQSG